MITIAYLTKNEYIELGFEDVDDFDTLEKRAEIAVDLFTQNFYAAVDFEKDYPIRKNAVKKAVAFQIAYLESSGIMTAEDKQSVASMTVGRTSVSFQNGSNSSQIANQYNLSLDAINWLKSSGFGYLGVAYDR